MTKRYAVVLLVFVIGLLLVTQAYGASDYKPELTLQSICVNPVSINFITKSGNHQPISLTDIIQIRAMNGTGVYQAYGSDWYDIPQGPHHNDGSQNFTMMVGDLQVICPHALGYDVLIYGNPDYPNLYWVALLRGSDFGFPLINTYQTSLRDFLLSDSAIKPIAIFVTNELKFDQQNVRVS